MGADSIATILTSVFLLFIILGLLFGWWRGYAKSLVRLGIVIGIAVLTFFVVPTISKALLSLDISNLNIVIGGNAATNVQELIIALLESIPYINDLMISSPAFESIIVLIPEILLNVVGFAVFFYLFRFASMIIYWIINAIAFPKKKQAGKNKHRMIGAVIGAVQGAVIAIILLLPIYGVINTASPIIKEQSVVTSNVQILSDYAYAEGEGSEEEPVFVKAFATAGDYLTAIENSFMTKVFNSIGVSKLADITFEKLTTVQYDNTELNLKQEINTINDAYNKISFIKNESIDLKNPEHAEKIDDAVEVLLTSKNISDIVSEIVVGVAEGWTNPEDPTFMGFGKPDFNDEDLNAAFDRILVQLKDTRNDVKKDVVALMDSYVIIAKSDLLTNSDAIEVLKLEKNELLVTNVLNELIKSPTIKECLPEVLNCAFKYGYKAVGFTEDQINNIGNVNTDAVIDDTEIARIENIADGVVIVYDQMNNAPEGAKLYEKVDFEALGLVLENIKESNLFKTENPDGTFDYSISLKLVQEILKTEKFVGAGNVDKFADLSTALGDVWSDPDADLKATFKGFGDAMKVADKMSATTPDSTITTDDVKDILETLKDNDSMKEVIDTVVTDDFLKNDMGMDADTADVVLDVVDKVINDANFDVENEIDAAVEIFNAASQIMQGETVTVDAEKIVAALGQSDSLTSLLASNSNENLNLKDNIEDSTRDEIKAEILSQELTEEKKQQLASIFGIDLEG